MQTASTESTAQPTPNRWQCATVAFALTAVVTGATLMTLIGESLAYLTDVESLALAAVSAGGAAGILWHHRMDRQDIENPVDEAGATGAIIGLLVPGLITLGVGIVGFPGVLMSSPGLILGLPFIVIAHTVFLSLPLGLLIGHLLGRLRY